MEPCFNMRAPFAVFKARLHSKSKRAVCFSRSGEEAVLCGWECGVLRTIERFGRSAGSARAPDLWNRMFGPDESFLDLAFHPEGELMALVGNGRKIEVRSLKDGSLVGALGREPARLDTTDVTASPFSRFSGYNCVAFTPCGSRIVAAPRYDDSPTNEVYELVGARLVASFSSRSNRYAQHPDADLMTIAQNDQGGSAVRFFQSLSRFGGSQRSTWAPPRLRLSGGEDEQGWDSGMLEIAGMAFNSQGDRLAIRSSLQQVGTSVFTFPDLTARAKNVTDSVRAAVGAGYRLHDRSVFHPRGQHLLVPESGGCIAEVDATAGVIVRSHHVFESHCIAIDADGTSGLVLACSSAADVSLLQLEE
jgi:hypothetical protein